MKFWKSLQSQINERVFTSELGHTQVWNECLLTLKWNLFSSSLCVLTSPDLPMHLVSVSVCFQNYNNKAQYKGFSQGNWKLKENKGKGNFPSKLKGWVFIWIYKGKLLHSKVKIWLDLWCVSWCLQFGKKYVLYLGC